MLKSWPLGQYRYVHFATHGFVNESIPELSGLMLAQDETVQEDGMLHLGEIYNLQLNADLVTLSACETGLGKMAYGEGLIGLARGFLYAGAQNLLVSLWEVNDLSTARLMTDFYIFFNEGGGKEESLRAAKLAMIEKDPIHITQDHLRKKYRQREESLEASYQSEEGQATRLKAEPIDVEILNKLDLEAALKQLPEKSRLILQLKSHGYKYKEIAEQVGISDSGIKIQVKRSIEQLRKILFPGLLMFIEGLIHFCDLLTACNDLL